MNNIVSTIYFTKRPIIFAYHMIPVLETLTLGREYSSNVNTTNARYVVDIIKQYLSCHLIEIWRGF